MKIEIALNTLDNKDWWFDLGISIQKTPYHENKRVCAVGFIFFTIYLRWGKNKLDDGEKTFHERLKEELEKL